MKALKNWAYGLVFMGAFSLVAAGCGGGGTGVEQTVTTGAAEAEALALLDEDLLEPETSQVMLKEVPATESGDAKSRIVPVVVSGTGTAVVDGVMTAGEWDRAGKIDFSANLPEGGTAPATLYVMNDGVHLYFSVKLPRHYVDAAHSVGFEFDNDNDGVMENGNDAVVYNPNTFLGLWDDFRTNLPPCSSGSMCGLLDTQDGGTNDGRAAFTNDGTDTVYEVSHPLDDADDAHDFSLSSGQTVGFNMFVRLIQLGAKWPYGFGDTQYPGPEMSAYAQILITEEKPAGPVADAGADKRVFAGETVSFVGSGISGSGATIVSYEWQFGDSESATGAEVTHVYREPGDYTVTLTVLDSRGASAQDSAAVQVVTIQTGVQDIISLMQAYGIPDGTYNSMTAKLDSAIASLNAGNKRAARGKLCAFSYEVRALLGKKLSVEQATKLIQAARFLARLAWDKNIK